MKIDDLIDDLTNSNIKRYGEVEENDHTGLQFYLMSPSPAANHPLSGQVPSLPIALSNIGNVFCGLHFVDVVRNRAQAL